MPTDTPRRRRSKKNIEVTVIWANEPSGEAIARGVAWLINRWEAKRAAQAQAGGQGGEQPTPAAAD
jgi:hypothetical protein